MNFSPLNCVREFGPCMANRTIMHACRKLISQPSHAWELWTDLQHCAQGTWKPKSPEKNSKCENMVLNQLQKDPCLQYENLDKRALHPLMLTGNSVFANQNSYVSINDLLVLISGVQFGSGKFSHVKDLVPGRAIGRCRTFTRRCLLWHLQVTRAALDPTFAFSFTFWAWQEQFCSASVSSLDKQLKTKATGSTDCGWNL